jgi:hypothetical protein
MDCIMGYIQETMLSLRYIPDLFHTTYLIRMKARRFWSYKGFNVIAKCGFRFVISGENITNIWSSWLVIVKKGVNKFQSMNTCLVEVCKNICMVSCYIEDCALQKDVIPYSREHMSKRFKVYLGMFHVSARVGIYSCLYTPQKATWFLKILFTKAKFEGHKWCKLKLWKKTQMVGSNWWGPR